MNIHSCPPELLPQAIELWRASEVRRLETAGLTSRASTTRVRRLEGGLRQIAGLLHQEYETPHLGNWQDPTDEFAFIALSRKTAERAYKASFQALKRAGDWSQVAVMNRAQVESIIRGCGLEAKKAEAILEGLRAIKDRFGCTDLSRAALLADPELFAFLASLPEIGPKSARCIMLYSFGRPAFPVDTHVGRVLSRLGIFLIIGLELEGRNHKIRQQLLAEAVPPDLRYGLHVNLIMHGRTVCRELYPRCNQCILLALCDFGKKSTRQPPSRSKRSRKSGS